MTKQDATHQMQQGAFRHSPERIASIEIPLNTLIDDSSSSLKMSFRAPEALSVKLQLRF